MRKKLFIFLLTIIISFGGFSGNFSYAKKDIDLFNGVLNLTQAAVAEYGIKATFTVEEGGENYCLNLFKKLNLAVKTINIAKDSNMYCLEFNNEYLDGYIESMSYENYNIITINILRKSQYTGFSQLKELIEKSVREKQKDIKYFQYVKAKISSSNLSKVNNNIIAFLKDNDATNVDTIDLGSGYSTVAYTKRYPSIVDDGKKIDFNYAVCGYSSGNYLIIGTPVIITSY